MSTYKVTRGPHYDADATIAVLELKFYILSPAKGIMNYNKPFLAVSTFVFINSSRLRNLFTH